jgi:phosphatidylinositol alpha-1,6-mannosyltransferase
MSTWLGRARYVCWTHGEELAETSSSRELTALFGVAQRHADLLIANSRHTAGLLEARGMDFGRIRIVYPGVDTNRFTPEVPGRDELRAQLAAPDELILLTIGRLQRRKGHDLVLRALSQLPEREAIRYVIVGDGEERERLTALADELRVGDRVRFMGKVPSGDLPRYYAAADIFAHPNRVDGQDFEGFGIVFLEAAASELPVIAGRSGGVPEAVASERTGLLVSGTDAVELQEAISALVRDPDRRRSLGRAGRVRARDEFSWERAAGRVAELHREVADKIAR